MFFLVTTIVTHRKMYFFISGRPTQFTQFTLPRILPTIPPELSLTWTTCTMWSFLRHRKNIGLGFSLILMGFLLTHSYWIFISCIFFSLHIELCPSPYVLCLVIYNQDFLYGCYNLTQLAYVSYTNQGIFAPHKWSAFKGQPKFTAPVRTIPDILGIIFPHHTLWYILPWLFLVTKPFALKIPILPDYVHQVFSSDKSYFPCFRRQWYTLTLAASNPEQDLQF